jgi:hypothetical protein
MFQQVTRRSALKAALGASLAATWFVAGCWKDEAVDTTVKTGEAKPAEESINGKANQDGPTAPPSPKQRLKGGPG